MNPYKQFINWDERERLVVEIDQQPESPREWSNLMKFYTFESEFVSPDKHEHNSMFNALVALLGNQVNEIRNQSNTITAFF